MARIPKIRFNSEKLDKDIKQAEGAKFNQGKISEFIMQRNKTYYCECMKDGTIAEEVLDKVCSYYDLSKDDYIVTQQTEQAEIQKKADTLNYENVLTHLGTISKTLNEILGQQRSIAYLLGELNNKMMGQNKHDKELISLLEDIKKKQQFPFKRSV